MDEQSTPLKTIQLHPMQSAFLRSKALFRCFCGGIGSGKTWCGSYDLIRKAKAGRLYLCVAPSYQMLQDSTFRIFIQVAEQLGVLDRRDVRRGAPPSIKIKTGAEILFRSADNPDSLRGPNLSGVWLDEGSLMSMDAFTVCVGRLREAGEMGWLTVTSTPKGKSNWMYDVFNSGRENTELIRCRTADNPFLAESFAATVQGQYTSHLALQELEGQFVDAEGSLFKRTWFAITTAPAEIISRTRAWDLAATKKDANKDPDWSAGVLLGKDKDGTAYIMDVKRLRDTPQKVEQAVRQTAELDGRAVAVWMEQEGGSSGKIAIDHFARRVLNGFNFRAERSTGPKAVRAQPLAAAAEHGLVKLVEGHWNKDFLDELELFPYGSHDDQVDAASLAFNKLASKREVWISTGDGPSEMPNKPLTDPIWDKIIESQFEKERNAGCRRVIPPGVY
jgi:predicted phage terminase large subunit-like protein